jgi:hypothetical protein
MKLLTEKDLAARWNLTTRTLQMQRRDGEGPVFLQIGERSVRYRLEDVEAYEKAKRVGRPKAEPEGWREAMKRAAGAFDLLAKKAATQKQKDTLTGLRDELRALLA